MLTIIIPSLVTILGFVISFIINKKEHLQSIQKFKLEKQISDLYGVQKDVLDYIDKLCILNTYPDTEQKEFNELQEKIDSIVIYTGSEDAVKLIAYIHSLIYTAKDDNIELPLRDLIAAYVLLAMQIKYDTTGIKTSPKAWYIGKYTTQKMLKYNFYSDSINAINDIVKKLKLKKFLIIQEAFYV